MGVWVADRHKPRIYRHRPQYGYAHRMERQVWAKVPKVCNICGQPIGPGQAWDLDHVIPVSLGGMNGPKRPAHERCNRRKQGIKDLRRVMKKKK